MPWQPLAGVRACTMTHQRENYACLWCAESLSVSPAGWWSGAEPRFAEPGSCAMALIRCRIDKCRPILRHNITHVWILPMPATISPSNRRCSTDSTQYSTRKYQGPMPGENAANRVSSSHVIVRRGRRGRTTVCGAAQKCTGEGQSFSSSAGDSRARSLQRAPAVV